VYIRFSALSEEEQDQWPTFQDEVNDAAKTVLACRDHPKTIGWHMKLLTSLTRKERPGCLAICRSTRHFVPNPRKAFFATSSSGPIILPPRPKKLYNVKDAFCNFRRLRSAGSRISSPVALADGTLVTDKSQKVSRWKDYFSNLLNPSPAPLSEDLVSAASTATS